MDKRLTYNLAQIDAAASFILKNTTANIILFEGDMGSGKTTLIKALVKALGGTDVASSPTFSIVNEYETASKKVYHFDLYRLNDEIEALDFGFEEYISDPNILVFIEWAEVVKNLLPDNSQKIRIIVKDFETRELQII